MTEPIRKIRTRVGDDGVPTASTPTSPTSNTVRSQCKAPPHTVVPIVFLPGIMGSNLVDKESGQSIWNVNSTMGLFFQWMFRSAKTRQRKLRTDDAQVDHGKSYSGRSATITSEKIALERGLAEVSHTGYAEFLHWLDDTLNLDCSASDTSDENDASPWKQWEGRIDIGEQWNAEKSPFLPITEPESAHAWNNFYCPVHARGYNWIGSNGRSGEVLACQLQDIIDSWNNLEVDGHKPYRCEKVILVTHSMGGLVGRACVHEEFGDAADKVLGIVHGVMPATGSAATYHHCRTGYDFPVGIALGSNAAQVTAIVANSPGALELLPTQGYMRQWLQAVGPSGVAPLRLPALNPYTEIYAEKEKWWRLIDPKLIDPAKTHRKAGDDPWVTYKTSLETVRLYHKNIAAYYHPQTYVYYGADEGKKLRSFGYLRWESRRAVELSDVDLHDAGIAKRSRSDPVILDAGNRTKYRIADPADPGDGTVPAISGQAPHNQGGSNVKQSFWLTGFGHSGSYDNKTARATVLHSIGKLLQKAAEL